MASWTENLVQARARLGKGSRFLLPSLQYLFSTEVHAYAFSIAANAYLSFFPFCLMLLTVCRRWLHWEGAYKIILELLRVRLPAGTESVIRNLDVLVQARPRLQVMSLLMLFFTTAGVFLPLEVALNKVWKIERNRSFLRNQAVSFALAVMTGILALFWVLLATTAQWFLTFLLNWMPAPGVLRGASRGLLEVVSIPFAISIFYAIYSFLPNAKLPTRRVLPAAALTGVLTIGASFIYVLTLPLFRFREVYGPFALSVTLLFWAYVGALILLFGAHLSVQSFWDELFTRDLTLKRLPSSVDSGGQER
ncbi:MAG: YihY/virulence factor BrkB family protein [Terriglobia bacterium]